MRLFRSFGSRSNSQTSKPGVPREVLPELHAFVDVALDSGSRRESISIDAIGEDTFSIRLIDGLRVGCRADFLYRNTVGQFRFATVCTRLDEREAHFTIPLDVKTIAAYGTQRACVRLEVIRPVYWRYAQRGTGSGESFKASMSDVSCRGAALVVDCDLTAATQVEIRFALNAMSRPLVVLSKVVRSAKIEKSGKNLVGMRFINVDGSVERTINEFIRECQLLRRNRGMV